MNSQDYVFYLHAKQLETALFDQAIQKSKEILTDSHLSQTKLNIIARRLSTDTFKAFQANLERNFPDPSYSDLIFLTVESRSSQFLQALRSQIAAIISGPTTA